MEILEWRGATPPGSPPPPRTKVTIVGKNEIYRWENRAVPFFGHNLLPPPPLPPVWYSPPCSVLPFQSPPPPPSPPSSTSLPPPLPLPFQTPPPLLLPWLQSPVRAGRSLRDQIFFSFLLRTALKDRPKGPPTTNRQLPSTAKPPPTANHQPPATNRCQPPAATNRQLPTTANRRQPPPTASCQPPTANRRQPPTANRHQPWLSTWSARGLFWENWFRNTFFFPLRTALVQRKARGTCMAQH